MTTKHFSVDARAILTLGRDSLRDHTTALIELVKNSYDADATRVEVEIFSTGPGSPLDFVRIADNGHGMTEADIDARWLRIGFSSKLSSRISPSKKRRRTGEKGIGRISADRLGATLVLRTKAADTSAVGLHIDWDRFDNPGKDIASIPIDTVENPTPTIPRLGGGLDEKVSKLPPSKIHGTEIIASKLRQTWSPDDIRVLHEELSTLTSPFDTTDDFEVRFLNNVIPELDGKIKSAFTDSATIKLTAQFDGGDTVVYTIEDRTTGEHPVKTTDQLTWQQLVHSHPSVKGTASLPPETGPVKVTLLLFPRNAQTLDRANLSMQGLREFLDKNAGIKIYRDRIRVKPYGTPSDPEGDWLGLGDRKTRNPAGAGRPDFRVAPNQIVGAVFIGRDTNPTLIDSSSREGLVNGPALKDLRRLTIGCITLLESSYHKAFIRQTELGLQGPPPSLDAKTLSSNLRALADDLSATKQQLADAGGTQASKSAKKIDDVVRRIKTTSASIERLASQATTYRGLSTIGIAATVFGHETQSSISHLVMSTTTIGVLLEKKPPLISDALEETDEARKSAERVASWGSFALARVRRDKRKKRKHELHSLVQSAVDELRPALESSNIEIKTNLAPCTGKTFAMDIESIIINLLTNAYWACLQTSRKRTIRVDLAPKSQNNKNGCELSVADSGPGIAKEHRERIWEPLFSTKTDSTGKQTGTGLGLSIVQSTLDELSGTRAVSIDNHLKGAKITLWLPLE